MTDPKHDRIVSIINLLLPSVHPEGWRFIVIFSAITLLLALLWLPLAVPGTIVTILCLYFFRDPHRLTPHHANLLISPADGVVQMILKALPPSELSIESSPRMRVSIFMSIFNCHVNRIPADGTVLRSVYRPGRFINAALDKASEDNERQVIHLALPDGRDLVFVQIAGLVARRIHCNLREGMVVQAGMRFGLIRFGSRVDVYLPEGILPLVVVGQAVIAGETILANLNTVAT